MLLDFGKLKVADCFRKQWYVKAQSNREEVKKRVDAGRPEPVGLKQTLPCKLYSQGSAMACPEPRGTRACTVVTPFSASYSFFLFLPS